MRIAEIRGYQPCAARPLRPRFFQCDPKNTQLETFGLERHICVYRGAYLLWGCGPSGIDLLGNGDFRGMRRTVGKFVAFAAAIGGSLLTSGCGDTLLLPAAGPNALMVRYGDTWHGPPYGVVPLTPNIVSILDEYGPRTLTAIFGDHRPPPEIKFGIGDVVSVSIFEAAAGGLFIPAEAGVRPGNFVTLPNQPVDTKGYISVPYAGLVPTAGKTPAEVEQEIVDRIKNRAIEPQVVVALVTQNTSLITVIGEVNNLITSHNGPHSGAAGGRAPARRDHPRRRPQGSGPGHLGGA